MAEANPFAKYLTEDEENPFAKYTKPTRKPDALDNVNPTDGMTGYEKFTAGMGKSMVDLGRGVGQFVNLVSRDDVAESRKRDRALMNTGAGIAGNIAGGVATLAPTAMIPGANTIAGAGLIGGITGLMQPSASTGETFTNAVVGMVGGAAIPAAITGLKVGKSFLEPLYQGGRDKIIGRAFNSAAGNQADDALLNLNRSTPLVQGSLPTAGESARNPGIAALQRTAIATDPVAMNEMALRQASNNEARIAALKAIIGDKSASVAARESAVNALYRQADKQNINITPEIEALLKRPVMKSAVSEAQNLSANEGRNFSLTQATQAQPSQLLGGNGLPAYMVPGKPGQMLGQDAHTIKRSLDDVIEGLAGQGGLAKNSRRAAGDTKEAFLNQVEAQVPVYGQARQTFANMSRPVNQSEVADLILQRATGNIQGTMTPASFNRALNDKTAKSALGRKGATLDNTFDSRQLDALNAIKTDLKNLNYAGSEGRGVGSDTVQKLAFSNMLNQSGLPEMVRGFAPASIVGNLAQKAGNVVYADANRKMSEQLARSLLDPKMVAKLMESGMTPKGLLALENGLIRSGVPLSGGLLGASYGFQ